MNYHKGNFDDDVHRGELAEELGHMLLTGDGLKTEYKRQDEAPRWGTLYIETEQKPFGRPPFVPSGLSISEADYWGFMVGALVIYVPTAYLRRIQPSCQMAETRHPDNDNPTRGFRLPLAWLYEQTITCGKER